MEWFNKAVVYQIYPIGYCGAPRENSFTPPKTGEGRILRVIEHIPEIKRLGFNTVMFNPLFESSVHGYDTVSFTKLDSRLGTNEDFKRVCDALHENGIRILLDGVFNHVGREFEQFKDVRQHKLGSRYKDWFHVRDGNSNYNDGFFYDGWEGHFELVKLNLYNQDVKNFLKDAVSAWVREFDIDGLRLDVAYSLEHNFLKELRTHCKGLKNDFWLMGETLHGDYNTWMNPQMLDSVTNYECYKGLHSSFNDMNMYEIAYSLGNRQFGPGGIYKGKQLYCFVDNHDVGRIASVLKEIRHLDAIYTLLFTMPGVPGVYYGSEYGIKGGKREGDDALRPEFSLSNYKELPITATIAKLAKAHAAFKPLCVGDYRQVILNNQYFAFARSCDGETVYSLINASAGVQGFNLGDSGEYTDILSGKTFDISKSVDVPAFGSMVLVKADKAAQSEEIAKPETPVKSESVTEKTVPAKESVKEIVKEVVVERLSAAQKAELTTRLKAINENIKALADYFDIPLE